MTTYERGIKLLQELEDLLIRMEKGEAKHEALALGRVLWFLLEQWCREHGEK